MRICIISNSHAASLKNGWAKLHNQFPSIDATFFAAPNRGMKKVKFDADSGCYFTNNSKVSEILRMTSGGCDRINLNDYDAFLIYSLFLEIPRLDVRLSEAVKSAALNETVSNSINFSFVNQIASNTQAAVFYSASPMPADCNTGDSSSEVTYHSFQETAAWVESRYTHLGATMIAQSTDTLTENNLTKQQYSVGSIRLKTGQPEVHAGTDTKHMNETYGAEYLERAVTLMMSQANISVAA